MKETSAVAVLSQDCVGMRQLINASRTSASQRRRPDLHRSYLIPVLTKAITIIRLLESSDRPLKINEIAAATGIAKTTVYRILRTLSAYGYLPQGSDGVYAFVSRSFTKA